MLSIHTRSGSGLFEVVRNEGIVHVTYDPQLAEHRIAFAAGLFLRGEDLAAFLLRLAG